MVRWEAMPGDRLARAALDLFAERGYDSTTVADIAERAGLTKSTFFRHFDDKREVLFGGQNGMIAAFAKSLSSAPAGDPPMTYIAELLDALAEYFPADQRLLTATRAAVIAAHPELRERELLKRAQLTANIETALRSREIDDVTTRLAATIGILAFDIGYRRWITHGDPRGFSAVLEEALQELVTKAAAFAQPSSNVC